MPAHPPDCRLLRFGLFEADLAAGELRKNGLRVKLQDRPFEILVILLEHPGEVITREEFRQRLWSADTFVDFDHSLNASINKLRQALNDVPDNPRFVATVGRRGYRFLAPVSYPTADLPAASPPGEFRAPQAPPVTEASALRATKHHVRTWVLSSCVALMALAAVFAVWISRASHPPLRESDSILLADFPNSTGDPAFDSSFREAIAIELGQSPFLNIVSNDRVRQTLREMSRPPDDSVQQVFAREVCERVGARAYLSGSLARLGAGYVLAMKAVNCADDTTLAHEQAEVRNRDALLPALDDVAARMRRRLGESLNSIRRFDVPVEEATTQSLEALKAYSLGQAQRARGAEKDSLPFYDHALDLDPNFAMAYAARAGAYENLGETERAALEIRQAYALRANLSEREKLILTVRYAKADTQRVIDTYNVWHQLYPRDGRPLNGLSARYQVIGDYEKAAEAARAALDLQPDNYAPYANLARSYEALGRFEDAKQVCAKALAAQRDSSHTHDVSLDIAFLQNDQATWDREIAAARGTDREEAGYWNEGLILASAGKLSLARPFFERSYAKRRQDKLDDFAAYAMAVEALIEADFGFAERARKQARQAIGLGRGIDSEITVAEILSLTGADAEASELAEDLHKRFPLHIPLNPATIPMILANIEVHKGNSVKAVQLLGQAIPYDFAEFTDLSPIYVRGQAYLHLGSGAEAAAEFQKILDHPGINVLFPRHQLALLGLARSYALMHDTAEARKAYESFFAKWSEADRNIPILVQAKMEYARLR